MSDNGPGVSWMLWLDGDESAGDGEGHSLYANAHDAMFAAMRVAAECEKPCAVYRCEFTHDGTAIPRESLYLAPGETEHPFMDVEQAMIACLVQAEAFAVLAESRGAELPNGHDIWKAADVMRQFLNMPRDGKSRERMVAQVDLFRSAMQEQGKPS